METEAPAGLTSRPRHRPRSWFVPVAAAADLVGWAVLVAVVPFGTNGTTLRGHACDPPTSAAPRWMWLTAFVAFAVAVALTSLARARKNSDTRAAACVFWVSVVSLFALVLIAAVALAGFRLGGCVE